MKQTTEESEALALVQYHYFSGEVVFAQTLKPTKRGQDSFYTIEFLVTDETKSEMQAVGIDTDRITRNGGKAFFQRYARYDAPKILLKTEEGLVPFRNIIGRGSKVRVKVGLKNTGRDKPFAFFVAARIDELVPYVSPEGF